MLLIIILILYSLMHLEKLINMEIKKAKKQDCKSVYSLVSILKENLDYNNLNCLLIIIFVKMVFSIIYYGKIIIQLVLLV